MSEKPDLRTRHGHPFDEATSALQKCIRRGLADDALYWAAQLEREFPHHVWRRLKVICHEDVGLADPMAIVQVQALHEASKELEKRPGQRMNQRAFMVQAVMLLARAPKSRAVDDATTVTWAEARDLKLKREVPSFAIDRHTKRGKEAGCGWADFFHEGCRIENAAELPEDAYWAERLEQHRPRDPRVSNRLERSEDE